MELIHLFGEQQQFPLTHFSTPAGAKKIKKNA